MGKRKFTLISMIEVIHLIVEMAYCIGNSVALNCDKVRLDKSTKKRYKELFQKELKLRCYGDSRTGTSRFGKYNKCSNH